MAEVERREYELALDNFEQFTTELSEEVKASTLSEAIGHLNSSILYGEGIMTLPEIDARAEKLKDSIEAKNISGKDKVLSEATEFLGYYLSFRKLANKNLYNKFKTDIIVYDSGTRFQRIITIEQIKKSLANYITKFREIISKGGEVTMDDSRENNWLLQVFSYQLNILVSDLDSQFVFSTKFISTTIRILEVLQELITWNEKFSPPSIAEWAITSNPIVQVSREKLLFFLNKLRHHNDRRKFYFQTSNIELGRIINEEPEHRFVFHLLKPFIDKSITYPSVKLESSADCYIYLRRLKDNARVKFKDWGYYEDVLKKADDCIEIFERTLKQEDNININRFNQFSSESIKYYSIKVKCIALITYLKQDLNISNLDDIQKRYYQLVALFIEINEKFEQEKGTQHQHSFYFHDSYPYRYFVEFSNVFIQHFAEIYGQIGNDKSQHIVKHDLLKLTFDIIDNANLYLSKWETNLRWVNHNSILPCYLPYEECFSKKWMLPGHTDAFTGKVFLDSSFIEPAQIELEWSLYREIRTTFFSKRLTFILKLYEGKEVELESKMLVMEERAREENTKMNHEQNTKSVQVLGIFASFIALITSGIAVLPKFAQVQDIFLFLLGLAVVLSGFLFMIDITIGDGKQVKKVHFLTFVSLIIIWLILFYSFY